MSAELNAQFELAANRVQGLNKLSNEERLRFYGLFKQGTNGDVSSKRPGLFDMVGAAKWDAWKANVGMPQAEAKRLYIHVVEQVTGTVVASSSAASRQQPEVEGEGDEGARRQDDSFGGMGNSVSTFSLRHGDPIWSDQQGIFQAIVDGQIDRVRGCLEAASGREGAQHAANLRDDNAMTPLHFAADRGLADVAALLLRHGACVDAVDTEGQSPLMLAVMCEHEDVVKLLLEHGADAGLANAGGETALTMDDVGATVRGLLQAHCKTAPAPAPASAPAPAPTPAPASAPAPAPAPAPVPAPVSTVPTAVPTQVSLSPLISARSSAQLPPPPPAAAAPHPAAPTAPAVPVTLAAMNSRAPAPAAVPRPGGGALAQVGAGRPG